MTVVSGFDVYGIGKRRQWFKVWLRACEFCVRSFGYHLKFHLRPLVEKEQPDESSAMNPKSIFSLQCYSFRALNAIWGRHLGSLQGGEGLVANSWIVHVFCASGISHVMFIPSVVSWSPNLDPCGKSVMLTGARKIRIKVLSVFLSIKHFPCSFLWLSLGALTLLLAAKTYSWYARAKITQKSFMFF